MSKNAEREPPDGLTLAFILVALVVGFTVLGYFADRWLHTVPWLMVAGVFVGAALGFGYLVVVLFTSSSKGRRRNGPKDGDEGQGEDSS